jgi:hypothetical protein
MKTDEEIVAAVLQSLINAAEAGDLLDPQDIWDAIDERPEAHLSEDAMLSYPHLRP